MKLKTQSSGFALITALLLLVGLMLLGISAMNMSLLDEKLAGNVAQRNNIYQLAEAALRRGEEEAASQIVDDTFTTGKAATWQIPRKQSAPSASGWAASGDWSTTSRTLNVVGAQSTHVVQHTIEELNDIVKSGDVPMQYLRVTARAVDPNTSATVILQSVVRRVRGD
jgi:type IV pilus assembly protein PilX